LIRFQETFFRPLQALVLLLPLCALTAAPARPAENQPLPDFRKLVKQNEAAIVNISSTQALGKQGRRPGMPELPGKENPYLEFFKRFFPGPTRIAGRPPIQFSGIGFCDLSRTVTS
jgi:serine protease Do